MAKRGMTDGDDGMVDENEQWLLVQGM